ncbi:MAG: adenylyltransferase/cytidyltransferase family protein [Ruminiclostridium sp.]|nr:adenylyltransferase/cytidyltransferase family protein [Ruminiclostridium sp.]
MGGTSENNKILEVGHLKGLRERFRGENKKVVQCHGVFDLLHPGHIGHLQEAKKLGDVLVVSVTSSRYINKGPGRPYFNDELRMKTLAALECVDYVILSEYPTAVEVIEEIKPDLYVKGSEYAASENDITGKIDAEAEKVREFGGDVYYSQGVVFSSTKLINNYFNVMPETTKEYLRGLSEKHTFTEVRNIVEEMCSKKVLVIGEVIIDEYIFCTMQGLMSKDHGFSTKYDMTETYLGGALAVARHIAAFSKDVTVCSIVGNEPGIHSRILNDLSKRMYIDLDFDDSFKTIVKRRYLARRGIRNDYDKLFSINYLDDRIAREPEMKADFHRKLADSASKYDIVIVSDFGHGLIDGKAMEIIQENACFLALNCQSNSSNYGTNIITKYKRADTFTVDEKELRLACSNNYDKVESLLPLLQKHFGEKSGWLTLGSRGALGVQGKNTCETGPALTLNVQDTVGAGDAFFAVASLCAHSGVPLPVGIFLGNIAGAIAANIMGNSRGIEKVELLKFASTLLNF